MPLTIVTDTTSLLYAPTHECVAVTFIGFDSIRDRCATLGIAEGMRLVVRGRSAGHVVVQWGTEAPRVVDAITARFVEVRQLRHHQPQPAVPAA